MVDKFVRYELRTTDPARARDFYIEVLELDPWGSELRLALLPERAAARGAPAHWLGEIGVADVSASTQRMLVRGAEQLAPIEHRADGTSRALLRDVFGAVLAVSSGEAAASPSCMTWHVLHVRDREHAVAWYAELFGWGARELVEIGPAGVALQWFGWNAQGEAAGGVSDMARLPHVHPHWLFHFRVSDLPRCLERVRALGGSSLGALATPAGDRFAACEDPLGAAFALHEPARPQSF